jgi:secreted trypsin-like serine protease
MANFDGSPFSFCTGTLISKNLVLTATHCISHLDEDEVFIHLGSKLPTSFADKSLLKVKSWKAHPQFEIVLGSQDQPVSGRNDIALISIDGELPRRAKPALIASNNKPLTQGQKVILAGFGIVEELYGPIYANELNNVEVPIAKLLDKMIITDQTSAKGGCSGDSGGPAFVKASNEFVVVGVTRGPHEEARDCRHYGEYTSVLHYKDFILDSAQELGAEVPQFIDLPEKL